MDSELALACSHTSMDVCSQDTVMLSDREKYIKPPENHTERINRLYVGNSYILEMANLEFGLTLRRLNIVSIFVLLQLNSKHKFFIDLT